MSISDLECIFHVLDNSIEAMYYLNRRKEIQQKVKYKGDELDLLGTYLGNGLNFGEIEKGEIVLQMLEMSTDVDQYFQAQSDGIVRKKPVRKFAPWFVAIRDQLAQSRPARWTEAATALVRISLDDQISFTQQFERVRNKIRRTPPRSDEKDSVLLVPPSWSEWGFAAISLRDPLSSDRHNKIESVAQELFSEVHVKRCLIVCRPIDQDAPAYSTLVLLDRPPSDDQSVQMA